MNEEEMAQVGPQRGGEEKKGKKTVKTVACT
jgi:hypothetical protein